MSPCEESGTENSQRQTEEAILGVDDVNFLFSNGGKQQLLLLMPVNAVIIH